MIMKWFREWRKRRAERKFQRLLATGEICKKHHYYHCWICYWQ